MNRRDKQSHFITQKQIKDVIDAADFAYRQGMPFTRFITINLKRLETSPQEYVSSFLKLAGDFLAFYGAPRAHIWFLEHPPGKSLNLHILIHVPRDMVLHFSRKERSWTKAAGIKLEKEVLKCEPISGEIGTGAFLCSTEYLVGYCLKGGVSAVLKLLRLDGSSQGIIYGKRVGWSESIGKAARDRAGYHFHPCERGAIIFPRRHRLEVGWEKNFNPEAEYKFWPGMAFSRI